MAWADQLNSKELDDLLSRYEAEISLHLALQEEKKRRSLYVPNRTEREACLWEMIAENIISSYRNELLWVQQLRQKLV